jgi:molybdopterin-guanine dinucleotide biosynthesis protein A
MFSAAILNGGQATRFGGRDKGALLVDGRTIVDRQLAELSQVTTDILVVTRDIVPGCGPLGGLHTALTDARGDAVFVVACDMPFIEAPLVQYLLDLTCEADAVVPRTERGYHPLCAAYTRACLPAIARRLAQRQLKMADLFADVRTRVVTSEELDRFGDRNRLLANVNTQAEYAGIQTHKP